MVKRPVFKKKLAALMVFLLVFQLVGGISPVFAEGRDGDGDAPVVSSVEVSAEEVSVGEELLVKAKVEDDPSGINSVRAKFYSPSEARTITITLLYNPNTALYEGSYTIEPTDEGGIWKFRYIYAYDNVSNGELYYADSFLNNLDFTVVNEAGDGEAPVITSMEVSAEEVTVGEEVQVKAKIEDDPSNIDSVRAKFYSPSEARTITITLLYNPETALYEGSYRVESTDEGGVWKFRYIYAYDNFSNGELYYADSFSNNLNFTVVNETGDGEAPVITSLEVSAEEVAAGEEVLVKAKVEDDPSGINSVRAKFYSPSEARTLTITLLYNPNTALYEGSYRVKAIDEEGVWVFRYISAYDGASNGELYYKETFNYSGSNLNFTIQHEESDLDNLIVNDPSLNYSVVTKTEAWQNKVINKDLYIGPNSTVYIDDNVTITGNVYVYGTLISHGGLTIQGDLNAKSVTYGSNSSASPGAVRIVGGQNSIGSMIVSNQPYDVPFAIYNENLTNEMGTAVIEGKTLPFLDVSLQGNPVALEADGSFKVTAEDITSDGLQFNLRDIFGNDMIKDIAVKDVLAPASVSGFTVTKTTNTEVHVSWAANKESDLKEYILSLNGDTTYTVPAGSTSYVFTELKEGTPYEFTIASIDQAANKSGVVKVNETTLLSKPVVNSVSEKDGSITGQAYPGTLITVKKADTVIGAGTVDTAGNYNVVIDPQKAGTELSVVASNKAGVVSKAAKVVVKDKTAPSVPTVKEVTDQSTKVEGTGEVASTITIKSDSAELATGKVDADGNYSITIAKQFAGTELQIFSVDATGNVSESKTITVIDVTKPSLPQVKAVTDTDTTVTGIAEVGAKITVTAGKTILNTGTAGTDGKFSVAIAKQKVGTVITVTAADQAGNISEAAETIVFDGVAPVISLTSKVTNHSTRIIGTSEADAVITVKEGTKTIGTAIADAKGIYEVVIEKQKVGAKLTVVAADATGNVSEAISIAVVDGNYPDLKLTHWALDEIMYLGEDQIIGGYPNGKFEPEKNTTRAEAAKMLSLALDLPVPDTSSGYKDVTNKHWAKNYVAAVSKAGLFNGNPDGTFAPDKILKRSEMAKIISIAYELKASESNHFNDVKSGYWAKGYISGLFENGITTGYPDKTFRAEEPTTRAEYSVFLARALNENFR